MHATFLVLSTALITLAVYRVAVMRGKRHPPGPWGLPFVGYVFGMPRRSHWNHWASQYGDIVHIKILDKHIVMLNSAQAVNDLLDKRSSIYSDRPHLPLINLIGQSFNFGFMPYGKPWSARRRTFANHFGRSLPQAYPSHSSAVMNLLRNLLCDPMHFMDHVQLHASQLILGITYGITVDSCEDPLIRNANELFESVAFVTRPEMWVVNPLILFHYLPKWLGGEYLAQRMEHWQTVARDFRELPYELAAKNEDTTTSFVKQLSETRPQSVSLAEFRDFVVDCSAVAYGGGSETTVAAGNSFFLAMALYPDAQREAQLEIARVVGTARLPNFSDRSELSYFSAIVRETLRWNPPAPLGLPHLLTEDDEYRGFHLPKGCVLVGDIRRILHNPAIYECPDEFRPERHLEYGKLIPEDPSCAAFGFGRRICPGRAFAEDSLWLVVAQVLAVFTISPVKETVLKARFDQGTFAHPVPFECEIKPRSEDATSVVQTPP